MTNVKFNAAVPNFLGLVDKILNEDLQLNVTQKPPVNIVETKESYDIHILAPGLKKDDFNIEVKDGLLSISYEKKETEEVTEMNFVKKEFTFQSFKRTFTLTDKVDNDKVQATYVDGILMVSIAKKEVAEPTSKTIKVN